MEGVCRKLAVEGEAGRGVRGGSLVCGASRDRKGGAGREKRGQGLQFKSSASETSSMGLCHVQMETAVGA